MAPDDKHKLKTKAEKYVHRYHKALQEKHHLMGKMHAFNAGYARFLQEEARKQH